MEFRDRFRYSWLAQALYIAWHFARGLLGRTRAGRMDHLALSYRASLALGWRHGAADLIMGSVEPHGGRASNIWFQERIGWERYGSLVEDGVVRINRSLILKSPVSPEERGVFMIWFEPNIVNLYKAERLEELLERFHIVFASAWSPPQPHAYWPMINFPGAELSLMISNPRDVDWMARTCDFPVVPLYMSSWEDPDFFSPKPVAERRYDILMVANWAPFKRHWRLFKALRDLPASLRVALAGQPEAGHTIEDVRALANRFGVPQEIEFFNRLPIDKVAELQANSVVSLILSKREGSCVAVPESLFADSPVGLVEGAHVGSAAFINEDTGMFLREERLSEDVWKMLARSRDGGFRARRWACENISCHRSTEVLNLFLRRLSERRGLPWTRDISAMCCRGAPEYFDPGEAERYRKEYAALLERHKLDVTLSARSGSSLKAQ